MSKAQQVRDHIAAHPGCTTGQVAAAIDWPQERVATVVWGDMRKKAPLIARVQDGINHFNNAPIYRLYIAGQEPGGSVPTPVKEKAPPVQERAEAPKETPIIGGMLSTLADRLAKELADMLLERVQQHLTTALASLLETASPHSKLSLDGLVAGLTKAPAKTSDKPVVLIAGLLPNQAGIISQDFGEVFDLRFFMSDENLKKLPAMAEHADYIVSFTSKIGHALDNLLVAAGKKYYRCSGGMTMLKDRLIQLYADGGKTDDTRPTH